MCGIAGGWWSQPSQAQTQLPEALQAMRRRGPDDQGFELYPSNSGVLALGQVRLSIIDLSSAGHQPMHSRDGRWAIVFNGEIYNYRELRHELQALGHIFITETDTEVLLVAWAQWGMLCLPRLAGMFAFAVLDKRNAVLTCVRDAFGIKPFFYSEGSQSFRFSSELPALLQILGKTPELNWQRVYDYLVHGDYDTSHRTTLAGICQLSPGHLLSVNLDNGKPSTQKRWWEPKIIERSEWKFNDAVQGVREQFLQNICLHLRSDVPLGAALSGGVDSSAVVCAMRHVEPDLPINTFSFIASGSDVNEERWVDLVNARVGAIPHKIHVTADELASDLDDMIKSQGEPFGSTSIYAQYRVFKLAKEHGMTVTLDGQGADEMLAGYNGYPGQRLLSLIDTGRVVEAWSFLNEWSKWPGRTRMHGLKTLAGQFTKGSKLYEYLRRMNQDDLTPEWLNAEFLRENGVSLSYPMNLVGPVQKGRRVVSELAASLSGQGLNALLRHGDRNSMRFSIESRVPFLTTDFADLLLSMPEDYLISPKGETKHIFRAAMRGIVPDEILDRRDKIGFATPEQDWLKKLAPKARQWLQESEPLPWLNKQAMIAEFDAIIGGKKPFSWQAWRFINFTRWYQLVFLPMSKA